MDIYRVFLPANTEVLILTATASTLALKLGCDREDAAVKVKVGEKSPKLLGRMSWLDTRNLYVVPGEEVRLTSNLATQVWYHFSEIEINEISLVMPAPSFTWNSNDETTWNNTDETLWNGG